MIKTTAIILVSSIFLGLISGGSAKAEITKAVLLEHKNTREILFIENVEQPDMQKVNHFLRDWRKKKTVEYDSKLIEALHEIATLTNQSRIYIICGYRTPATNKDLPGTAEHSYHMKGQAIDFTLNVEYSKLKKIVEQVAKKYDLGLGIYNREKFFHIDTGPGNRRWVGN